MIQKMDWAVLAIPQRWRREHADRGVPRLSDVQSGDIVGIGEGGKEFQRCCKRKKNLRWSLMKVQSDQPAY